MALKKGKTTALEPILIDTALVKYDKKELIAELKSVDPKYGNVTEGFVPFGFRIDKLKNGISVLHLAGALVRDKQSNEFSVDLDLNSTEDKIYILQYKL